MAWRIEFERDALRELDALDRQIAMRLLRFLTERLPHADNPRAIGEALKGPRLGRFWKYRVGDYRAIAQIDDAGARILIVRIGHRRDVYR